MNPGYLYVLTHPSKPDLYKVGQTIRHPQVRLAEHNSGYDKYAGQIVKETGQKWELKTYISVPDPYWAEAVFWNTTPFAVLPYRYGIEVQVMPWEEVQKGLVAARKAGLRPPPGPIPDHIYAYRAWMNKRLYGRGITLIGEVRSKAGKSNFRCSNGHQWRTTPMNVAKGEGCPHCGMGERNLIELLKAIKVGTIHLLIHPNKPGFIKIGLKYAGIEHQEENIWKEWEEHRYRSVEEPELALSLVMELLGMPEADPFEPIEIDLDTAEKAFRELHYRLDSEIALRERAKELPVTP